MIVTSTLRMQLDAAGFVKNAAQLAQAVDADVKRLEALKTALRDTGGTDRLQGSLQKLGASSSHIEGVKRALEAQRKELGVVGVAWDKLTADQKKSLRAVESTAVAVVRSEIAEEKRLTAAIKGEEETRLEAVRASARAQEAVEQRLREQIAEQDRKAENRRIAVLAADLGHKTGAAKREQAMRAAIEVEVTAKVKAEGQHRVAASQAEAVAIERIANHERELRIRAIQAETTAIVAARHRQAEAEAEAMAHAQSRAGFRHMVAQGVAGYASAHGVVHAGERVLEAGAELQHERVQMTNAGISPADVVKIQDQSLRLSAAVGNVSQGKIMETAKELRSMIADPKELAEVLDPIIKAKSVIDGMDTTGASSEGLPQLLKAAELVGAATDPARLTKLVDGWVKVMQVSGKTVNPESIFEFVKYSKTAGATLSDRFLTTVGPSILQELGGSTTGNDIAMLSKSIATGFGKNHTSMKEAARIGLINPGDIDYLKTGEAKGLKQGTEHAVAGDKLFQTDPDQWVYQVLVPLMEKAGIKATEDQLSFVQKVFTGTSADFIAKTITQRKAYDTHAENYAEAKGLAAVGENANDAVVGLTSLRTAIGNLAANTSAPLMAPIGRAFDMIAGGINRVAEVAAEHPVAAPVVGGVVGAAALGASGYLSWKAISGFGTAGTTMMSAGEIQLTAAQTFARAVGVKAAEDVAEGGAAGGLLKKLAPGLAVAGPLGVVGAGVAGVMLNRDQSKSLVDGGRPDVLPSDNNLGLPGFARGGYTGDGGRDAVAGVVHGGEYVFDADQTDRLFRVMAAIRGGNIDVSRSSTLSRVALATDSSSAAALRQVVGEGMYDALRRIRNEGGLDADGHGTTGGGDGGGTPNMRYGRGGSGRYRGTPGTGQDYELGPHIGLGRMGAKFAEKAPTIMDGLMKKYGLTREQAAGIIGNLGHESGGFTKYHEGGKAPGSGGVGWAQWTGPRRRAFEAWTAAHGLNPTSDEASWRYLTEGDPETPGAIAAVKRESTVAGSMRAFEGHFERAGIKAYGSRMRFANAAMGMQPSGATVAASGPAQPATMGEHLADLKQNGMLSDEQCVTLAMASVGIRKGSGTDGANVHDWRKGAMADSGRLTPGTPVATFLNRDGSQNKDGLYAGGGAGTPGAHLDHAGVFQKYFKDASGKIVGMTIAEQYQGSGGVHSRNYMFGQGRGEGNGSNYAAVTLKGGGYLGGTRNPMEGDSALAGGQPNARDIVRAADGAGPSRAVDILDKLDRADDKTVAKALGAKMHVGEWCADAVNGALEQAGVRGTGSPMSDSFKKWGKHVEQTALKRGDVLVESGRRPNGEVLGHVGLATGLVKDMAGHITTADKAVGGITAIGMTSGNHGDMVRRNYWENPDLVTDVRRADPEAQRAAERAVLPRKAPAGASASPPQTAPADVNVKVSGLDSLREAHQYLDSIHRKAASLNGVNIRSHVHHEDHVAGSARPGTLRTALNGHYGSDGRSWT